MGAFNRRDFFKSSIAAGVILNWGGIWKNLEANQKQGTKRNLDKNAQWELIEDPEGILDLPKGFSYKVIGRNGELMSDGCYSPNKPDAMGLFLSPDKSEYFLMRNHEVDLDDIGGGPFRDYRAYPPEMYSPRGHGGVSKLVIDAKTLEIKKKIMVLCGTAKNCAGGLSPWGWLTCEETMEDTQHGYVFLCNPLAEKLQAPHRIDAYGRFNHEAATVDPATHIAYLTEDRKDGSFYRFRPDSFSKPFGKGVFEALKVKGTKNFLTNQGLQIGDALDVEWVQVDHPCTDQDDVRFQAQDRGAAILKRGEGLWLHQGEVYFSATAGGPQDLGQIFKYVTKKGTMEREGTLHLVTQSEDSDKLNMPDNITISPQGFLTMAEDGGGHCHIRILTAKGNILTLARNAIRTESEFAGVCFSPDGAHLFVNIQHEGLTMVISGPFNQFVSEGDK